jgi:hypothetical protein
MHGDVLLDFPVRMGFGFGNGGIIPTNYSNFGVEQSKEIFEPKLNSQGSPEQVRFEQPTFPQGLKEAAEKGLISRDLAQGTSAGAKALLISLALSARLKSCPVTKPQKWSFSAAC